MKRIRIFMTLAGAAAFPTLWSQPVAEPSQTSLPQRIGEIAELDAPAASDFHEIAAGTLALGQQAKQNGQPLPDSAVYDALDAVEAGREREAGATDWDKLQQALEALLEPPPEQEEEQEQPGEGEGESNDQEQQDSQQGESGDSSQENQDGQPEQEQEQEQGQSEGDGEQEGQEGNQEDASQEQSGDPSQGENAPRQDGAQMGDLNEPQQPMELSQPEGAPEDMQTLGGRASDEQAISAEKAALMQMLEQLRQQDDPGRLFQILQDAQKGEPSQPQPNTKDW